MNFLSHDFILPPGSTGVTRVGVLLPDLWALLPRRPLPLVVIRSLRASGDEQGNRLAEGIESHMRADAVFHGHEEFERRTSWAARDLTSAFPSLRYAQLAAHVAVEMLLDRWLIDRHPGMLDRHYGALDADSLDRACGLTFAQQGEQQTVMRQVLERYVSSAFLREYRTDGGMVGRWLRSLSRSPFSGNGVLDEARLEEWMGVWRERFAEGSESLLDQVKKAVDSWAVDHPAT
jgi:hypothetical protein